MILYYLVALVVLDYTALCTVIRYLQNYLSDLK